MANEIKNAIDTAFRDYVTDGLPSSGANTPSKAQIRSAGQVIQTQIDAATTARNAADALLQDNIDAETAARVAADSALQTEVDAALAAALLGVKPRVSSVRVLTTTDVATATALENGDTLDGVTLATGDRVAKAYNGATGASSNGIWIVQASGAAVRAIDFDTSSEILNSVFKVDEGTYQGEYWGVKNTSAITVNTTAIVIERVEAASGIEGDVIDQGKRLSRAEVTIGAVTRKVRKRIGLPSGTTPVNANSSANQVYVFNDPIGVYGHIVECGGYLEGTGTSVQVRMYSPIDYPIKQGGSARWADSRTLTLTQKTGGAVNTWSVDLGDFDPHPVIPTDRIGLYANLNLSVQATTNGDSGGYFAVQAANVGVVDAPLAASGVFGARVQFYVEVEYEEVITDNVPPWQVRPGYEMKPDHDYNHALAYSQSTRMGADATPPLYTTDSVRHLMLSPSTKMNKPGIFNSGGGTAYDSNGLIPLVEDDLDPDTLVPYGETGCFWFAAGYTRRAMRSGQDIPLWIVTTAGKSGYALSSGADSGTTGFSNLQPNGNWYENVAFHIETAYDEAVAAGKTYQVAFVNFTFGQTDLSSARSTSYFLFRQRLDSVIETTNVDAMAITGQSRRPIWLGNVPVLNIKATATAMSTVIKALYDAERDRDDMYLVLADYRLPHVNASHPSNIGIVLDNAYHERAAYQYANGRIPDRCRWGAVTVSGTTVTARISHPGSSLRTFADAHSNINVQMGSSSQTTDGGIKIVDDTGTLTLSAISLSSAAPTAVYNPVTQMYESEITMTINRSLGANPKFRYACDYLSSGRVAIGSGADGLIYDNTSETVTIDGSAYLMSHMALPCEIDIVESE